ncbi:hydrogenase subunit MbhD domain-containing protein [Halopseudomonas xiamenensis]|uniref:hydrogenase subunit MbhD domain-containing protein n=1 Tax=Halopseudomonas xiamenensis TaxID=157792 RepID=UPI0016276E35|nr:hydrogenase subunit MbhD domain-containing protein [Halopseudomonas xiamenensis]
MPATELLLDITLGVLLLILAGAALHGTRLYTGIISFIAFGLLLALVWARLGAPDLALAEAAIGAGLTGVLLLSALGRHADEPAQPGSAVRTLATLLLGVLVLILLLRAVLPLAQGPQPLPALVNSQLEASGVSHPVTAVLLNFRAWDTLLELLVLLLAVLGVRQLQPAGRPRPGVWPLLQAWSRILAPLSVIIGGYLLWRGSHAPGGAFQAGALLAAGVVMLRLAGLLPLLRWENGLLRLLVLVGVALFLTVAAAGAWFGAGWLNYPAHWSGALIVLIEVAATLSIAASLSLLVVGERQELGR